MIGPIAHVRQLDGDVQALQSHLKNVAALCRCFAAKLAMAECGELIGLLHDLGKYADAFQAYIKSATGLLNQDEDEDFVDAADLKGKIDHSTAGAQFIWQALSKHGQLGEIVGQVLALCVASHHSGLIDCLAADADRFGQDNFSRRMSKATERTHLTEVVESADAAILSKADELLSNPDLIRSVQERFGRIIRSAPGKTDKSIVAQQQLGLMVRFLFSCLIDADRIDTIDFEKPHIARQRQHGHYQDWALLIGRLERHLSDFKLEKPIDHIRRDISDHCLQRASSPKGIFTLTVPTGGGKTLASLRFALHHALHHAKTDGFDRVIYVIPFTSIIDQNAKVVRKILEPDGEECDRGKIVLEHHSNLTPEQQGWREKILTENWDAPVIYTTGVQFLEALFGAGTRGARRMHQLSKAVIIFDEIQTLPVNCVHLFNNAISFLVEQCGSTVLMCTATQPLLHEVCPKLGAIRLTPRSELMPDVSRLFLDLKRVEVRNRCKPGGWTDEEIAALALAEANRAGSCLVVVNTKRSARSLFQLCAERTDVNTFHLSTSMCPAHRKEKLAAIIERLDNLKPTLCISTQLIEAGVDVDFGAVIRFTAGLDSIAQAAGRCNRHGRREIGVVHVVNPAKENLDRLSDIRIGREKTERVLCDFEEKPERFGNDLIGPEAIRWYFQTYFFDRAKEMAYPVCAQSLGHDDNLLNLLSSNHLTCSEHRKKTKAAPGIYLKQSFMTAAKAFKAIDTPTRGVIVPYGEAGKKLIVDLCGAHDVEKQFDLLRQSQQFTVNIFEWQFKKMQETGAIFKIQNDTDIFHLDSRYYHDDFGLSAEPFGSMEFLNA